MKISSKIYLWTSKKDVAKEAVTKACDLPVHQCVFQQWCHGVYIILAHLANVLEHKWQRLENAVLHIQFWHTIFVHQARQNGKRRARLGNDCYGNCRTHTILSLLHLQIIQQRRQHVMRTANTTWNNHVLTLEGNDMSATKWLIDWVRLNVPPNTL